MRPLQLGRVVTASALVAIGVAVVSPPVAASAAGPTTRCRTDETHYIDQASTTANADRLGLVAAAKVADGKGVTVAVVDSGVDDGNKHLADAVSGGHSFVGGADDGTTDDAGHGTAVAGVIAARPVDGSVLVGAAPAATIMPVRYFDRDPATTELADSIRWAADHGADVINVSSSTGVDDPQLGALRDAVEDATKKGALVVAAAGNQTEDSALTQLRFPAAFPGVLGVTATGPTGAVTNWSVHGSQVDVAAPGQSVLTTFHAAGDCLISADHPETSWATGYVSALAAQLVQKYPKDSPATIANRIMQTADRPTDDQRDDQQGWGVIQPLAALTRSTGKAPGVVSRDASADRVTGLTPLATTPDRLATPRHTMIWWSIGAAGLVCLALVLRPLALLRRRS